MSVLRWKSHKKLRALMLGMLLLMLGSGLGVLGSRWLAKPDSTHYGYQRQAKQSHYGGKGNIGSLTRASERESVDRVETNSNSVTETRLIWEKSSTYKIKRPIGWKKEVDERVVGGRVETVWRDPGDTNTAIVVDAVSGDRRDVKDVAIDARDAAAGVLTEKFESFQVGGREGYRWVFNVENDKRIDIFLSACDSSFAILGSTSPSRFAELIPVFHGVAESVACKGFSVSSEPDSSRPMSSAEDCGQDSNDSPPCDRYNPPVDFCDLHDCIDNFDNGNGFVTQCADGMWSQSGGLSGACSSHGGEIYKRSEGSSDEQSSPYSVPSGSNPRSGGSSSQAPTYPVQCEDGTVSQSGGHQGACSHHGGRR